MTIPKYDELMYPLLSLYNDDKTHNYKEFSSQIIQKLKLSEDIVNVKIKSGQSQFINNLYWANTYLFNAEFLNRESRGNYTITQRGKEVLKKTTFIDKKFILSSYPELKAQNFWKVNAKSDVDTLVVDNLVISDVPPEQRIETEIQKLEINTKNEILSTLKEIEPRKFEFLVIKLLEKLGYGVGEVTQYSKDGGIDGVVKGDTLGFEKIYIQAKRYKENNVQLSEIKHFIASINNNDKGLFITTSDFTSSIYTYLSKRNEKVVLINGQELVNLMFRLNLGVSMSYQYEVKNIDTDFFELLDK
ncbi:restriction endonuclease [Brasilonema sp. CT11]|nr:restriction endonuclease [Brasilonema sp. CT11]